MQIRCRLVAGCAAAELILGTAGCGPLALDPAPHIRGSIVSVAPDAVTVRHKSGRTVRLVVTRETRILWEGDAAATLDDVCARQRAHAVLDDEASRVRELRVSGRRCR